MYGVGVNVIRSIHVRMEVVSETENYIRRNVRCILDDLTVSYK